jgi:hypothetical protein
MITVLGAAAALLALSAAVIVTALHAVGTEVDPRVDGVSAYALTPFGLLYRLQVLATGTAALLLVLALVSLSCLAILRSRVRAVEIVT